MLDATPLLPSSYLKVFRYFSGIGGVTRKHFRLLADALRRNAPTFATSDAEIELFVQIPRAPDIGPAGRRFQLTGSTPKQCGGMLWSERKSPGAPAVSRRIQEPAVHVER